MNKYSLQLSRDVPGAGGYSNLLKVGLPEDRDMVNDICITALGSYEFIALNARILRQALLNNPEKTKQLLGIIVEDATIKKEIKPVEQKNINKGAKK